MSYKRTVWVNGETPINADNLNNMEDGIAGAYSLTDSISIPANSDLNDYITPGNYSVNAGTITVTIANVPDSINVGFYMKVIKQYNTSTSPIQQDLFVGNSFAKYSRRKSSNGTWSAWVKSLNEEDGIIGVAASAKGSSASLSLPAGTITKVPLDTWVARTDEAFTFSDGGIKCPYDGTVLISGNVYVSCSSTTTAGCYVYKGTTEIVSQYRTQGTGCVTSGVVIMNVSAGDIIYIKARSSVAGTCIPNNAGLSLNVVYIK